MACKCIEHLNGELRKYNTALATNIQFDFNTGCGKLALPLPTRKIDSAKKAPAKVVYGGYCPVCGKSTEAKKPKRKKTAAR